MKRSKQGELATRRPETEEDTEAGETYEESPPTAGTSRKRKVNSGYEERREKVRIDYVKTIGQARALEHMQRWIREHEYNPDKPEGERARADKWHLDFDTGCWILTSGLTSKGTAAREAGAPRYGLAKLHTNEQLKALARGEKLPKNPHVNFQWHVLAYLAMTGRNVKQDASHLCGRSQCFNPSHIVDEDHNTNLNRRYCTGDIWCTKHDHLVINLCTHDPPCIKPYFREDIPPVSCCRSPSPESQESASPFIPESQLSPALRTARGESQSSGWGNLEATDLPIPSSPPPRQSHSQARQNNRRAEKHKAALDEFQALNAEETPGAEYLKVAKAAGDTATLKVDLVKGGGEESDYGDDFFQQALDEATAARLEEMATGLRAKGKGKET